MSDPAVAPFGSWASPISAATVAAGGDSLFGVQLSGGLLHWIEARRAESGRQVIVRATPYSEPIDVTPAGFNARTTVHEYGGGDYWLHDETVFFAQFEDQRLYRQDDPWSTPAPITPETGGRHRYADGRALPGGELLVCVRERHEDGDVTNELVALACDGSREPWVIAGGHDFYSFPRVSGDGARLAWTCWDHPRMPWDGTELWVCELEADARPRDPRRVAGGPNESVQQPVWSPDGELHFVSDRTGWWNLYRLEEGRAAVGLAPIQAEFGQAQWVFGLSTYGFLEDGRIACVYGGGGEHHFALLDPGSSELLDLDLPYTSAPADAPQLVADGSQIAFVAGAPTIPHAVVSLDFTSRAVDVVRESSAGALDPAIVSEPRHIEFPAGGGLTSHALFYAPRNPQVRGPEDERPPLVVMSHGGPTGSAGAELDLETQFWTSRGFAVVDVNYGGSTGYGREYRERLRNNWGVTDVMDCIAAARFLADAGHVDGDRLTIRGGSAGGYTTLCALTFHAEVFAAGASYYGVADAEALARDTHKFESHYLDGLIGPLPQAQDTYRARSPIHFTDLLERPVILLQGLEDKVVPPSQAEAMIAALDAKGLAYAYLAFEGEQHGFRKPENIQRALSSELFFYSRVLGFPPPDGNEPVEIHNL